jgi:hypothetical protein
MRAIIGGSGLLFRFLIAGMTAILVVSTMSMAIGFVVGPASRTGEGGGGLTGGFIQAAPGATQIFFAAEILVGIITFLGSFYVLSKR